MIYAKCTCGEVATFQDEEDKRTIFRCSQCGMECDMREAVQREKNIENGLESVGQLLDKTYGQ